ncbi:uncharacterized protein RJT20DRAFT_132402 [Scheffersomyces xylosifermentans]|uniref:uncharacterized protein n=1 Tax=Scheffersomyces xylosifermentans TaxID=1304137 RepID=UPI00315C99C4
MFSRHRQRLSEYAKFLGFYLPLAITRNWFYFLTFVITFAVLLPLSILTYIRFYQTLIPHSSPRIPLVFHGVRSHTVSEPTLVEHALRRYEFDTLLKYNLNLNLVVVCSPFDINNYKVPYSIVDQTTNTRLFNDTFFLDCDPNVIYSSNNLYIPFNLRFWVSPVLVDLSRSIQFSLTKLGMSGKQVLEKLGHFKVEVDQRLTILDDVSYVQFEAEYNGFRYYLVKHYYICLIIGTGIFWATSASIGSLTSFIILQKYSQDDNNNDDDNWESETEEVPASPIGSPTPSSPARSPTRSL